MIPSQISPCQVYRVKLNPDTRTPIVDTMQATSSTWKIKDPCLEAIVPTTQMTHVGSCLPPTKLRYWYRVSKITGNILPNSMVAMPKRPTNQCAGQEEILEFVIYPQA